MHNAGKYLIFYGFKCITVSEKTGEMDQQILEQSFHFRRVVLNTRNVILQLFQPVQSHPPPNSPLEGGVLVMGKVNARGRPQQGEDVLQRLLAGREYLKRFY